MTSIAQLPRTHGVVVLLNPFRHLLVANIRLNLFHQSSVFSFRFMAPGEQKRLKSFQQFGAPLLSLLALA
jgi:hypothetical protein